MESMDVVRLGLVLAIQAEIEGMKAENEQRKQNGEAMAFTDVDFQAKADELRNVAYTHVWLDLATSQSQCTYAPPDGFSPWDEIPENTLEKEK